MGMRMAIEVGPEDILQLHVIPGHISLMVPANMKHYHAKPCLLALDIYIEQPQECTYMQYMFYKNNIYECWMVHYNYANFVHKSIGMHGWAHLNRV